MKNSYSRNFSVMFFTIAAMTIWPALADNNSPAMVSQGVSSVSSRPYLLVAPLRESAAKGEKDYGPVAAFLSKVTGHPFVYARPTSWLNYEKWIWEDHGDVYFDGPHFIAWRLHNLHASLGPRVPQPQEWRIYTWKGDPAVKTLADVAEGTSFCAPPVPNFGTLWAMSLFQNPMRQPLWVDTKGWGPIFKKVMAHECAVGVAPKLALKKLDPQRTKVTVLTRGPRLPNQGFSISYKVPPALREKIVRALLSPAGERALLPLRQRFSHGAPFVAGNPADYTTVYGPLTEAWGAMYGAVIARYLKRDAAREGFPNPVSAHVSSAIPHP